MYRRVQLTDRADPEGKLSTEFLVYLFQTFNLHFINCILFGHLYVKERVTTVVLCSRVCWKIKRFLVRVLTYTRDIVQHVYNYGNDKHLTRTVSQIKG